MVQFLAEQIEAVAKSEPMAALAARIGGSIEIHLRDDFARRIALEGERLAPIIKAAGMKVAD